jgi:thioesterase domain-containing protein
MGALAEVWAPLLAAVQEEQGTAERPLWVTGHSLGGALALLAAWRFERQFIQVHEVVTFGAPMVGNGEAARALDAAFAGRVHRYVDVEDPVPLLPSMSLVANVYAHCPNEVRLQGPNPQSFAEVLSALGARAVDGLLGASLIDEVWSLLQRRIAAHLIPNYQERLRG